MATGIVEVGDEGEGGDEEDVVSGEQDATLIGLRVLCDTPRACRA